MKRFVGVGLIVSTLSAGDIFLLANGGQAQSAPNPVEMNLPLTDNSTEYQRLQSLLAAQNWQAADQETRRILEPYGGLYSQSAHTIPVEMIQTLDQLWREASNERFGLTVQQRIWEEAQAQHPNDVNAAVKAFGDRVGWTRTTDPGDYQFVAPDWLTETELNFSRSAPEGHLPWAGVSWEIVSNIVQEPGCGSCATDALYLQGERFTQYIPALYGRVETVLDFFSRPIDRWRNAQIQRQIDLRAMYPNSSCPVYTRDQAISPNSALLAVSSYSYERSCSSRDNSTLALWNAERGTRIITLLRGQATESFSYSGQAQEPPTESTRIVGDVANAIAFTPDSRQIAAGLSNGTVRLWNTSNGEVIRTLSGHRYAVRAIAISLDGRFLASASADQTIKLWNLQTGQLIQTIRQQPNDGIIHTILISPNGQRIATATDSNKLQLWEFATGRLIRTVVDGVAGTGDRLPIAFSPDSQTLATADLDHSVKVWNANTGARIITLRGHQQTLQDLAFSPDSKTLASSSTDHTVRLWNLNTYQGIRTLNVAQSAGHPIRPTNLGYLAFSPDGQLLATSTLLLPVVQSEPIPTQGVTVWDVSTGQPLTQIHSVTDFSFSPNNQFLIANGRTLQIWQP